MKKIFSILALIIITSSLFVGCGKESKKENAEKPETITIGNVNGNFSAVVYKEKKFFEDEFKKDGIKIEYSNFDSGPTAIDSFINKKLDVAQLGDQPVISGIANGVGIKVIGSTIASPKFVGLVAGNNSGINSIKDIKGKKIGVSVGTIYHHLLWEYLKQNNIKEKDIQLVNLNFADSVSSLAQGNVDLIAIGEPYLSMIAEKKLGKLIVDGEGALRPTTPIVVSADFYKKYPEITKRILKVYENINEWIGENKEEAATLATKEVPISKESLLNLLKLSESDIDINDDVKKELKSTYNFLKESGALNGKIKNLNDIYITFK